MYSPFLQKNQGSMWYTDWWQVGGREAQANMEETDGEKCS